MKVHLYLILHFFYISVENSEKHILQKQKAYK